MQLHFDAPSVASLKGASVMRAAEAETQRSVCSDRRTELEDAVFEALGKLYDLPPKQAVESAGFVAGQIAAFLADVARLNGDPVQAERARGSDGTDKPLSCSASQLAKVAQLRGGDDATLGRARE